MRGDASPAALDEHVNSMRLSFFNRIMTRLAFRTVLVKSAYTREQFQQMVAQTEFGKVEISKTPLGLEIAMAKGVRD